VKLQPIDDKVVIRRKEAESKTPGGVYLPDKAKDVPREGVIVAVGPGRLLENGTRAELQVKVGDRVLFTSFAGNECDCDGVEFLIMCESDILAVLEPKDDGDTSKSLIQGPTLRKKVMIPHDSKKKYATA
jgi:chaperonin GroES